MAPRRPAPGPRKLAIAAAYHRRELERLERVGIASLREVERHRGRLEAANAALDAAVLCRLCGASLTDPISRARRVGPECIRKPEGAALAASSA